MITSIGNEFCTSCFKDVGSRLYQRMDVDKDGTIGKSEAAAFVLDITGDMTNFFSDDDREESKYDNSLSDFIDSLNPYDEASNWSGNTENKSAAVFSQSDSSTGIQRALQSYLTQSESVSLSGLSTLSNINGLFS